MKIGVNFGLKFFGSIGFEESPLKATPWEKVLGLGEPYSKPNGQKFVDIYHIISFYGQAPQRVSIKYW